MHTRKLSVIAGTSYLVIFFAAIFANFFVLELIAKSPLEAIQQRQILIRAGIMAFVITVLFDVIVAWALYELYKSHYFSNLSASFRMMHAAIMAVAIYALAQTFKSNTTQDILQQVEIFNTIWLIGLFFFGAHLILLGRIIGRPKIISFFLAVAGIMYMIDTTAHFMLPNYEEYHSIFLTLVAIPSIVGEMAFAIWLLVKGGKEKIKQVLPE